MTLSIFSNYDNVRQFHDISSFSLPIILTTPHLRPHYHETSCHLMLSCITHPHSLCMSHESASPHLQTG